MKFITDENIYVPIVEELKNLGHDVLDIKEQNLIGTEDSDIYKMALDQYRILLSMDKDFSDILKYPPGEHYGIIVLKVYRLNILITKKIFLNAFQALTEKDIHGHTVIIDRVKTRVRKEKLS